MDFIVFSDFHANLWQEFSKPDMEYGNTRFREMVEVLEEVISLAKTNNASIIFTGDLFHQRNKVDTIVYNTMFNLVSSSGVNWILLRGNHDSVDNSLRSETSLYPFGDLPNVKLVDKPETFEYEGISITAVPYGDEVDEIKEFIENATFKDTSKPKVLIAHFGVAGATTGTQSHRLEGAISYADLQPDYFSAVLLGHYHNRQNLGGNPNVVYVGNTLQTSFGDIDQAKGVYVFDKDFTGIEFLPIKSKRFLTIDGDDIPDNIEDLIKDNYVRFRGNAKQSEIFKSEGVDTSTVRVELVREFKHDTRLKGIEATSSPEHIVKSYAEQYYPDTGVASKALACLKEVQ